MDFGKILEQWEKRDGGEASGSGQRPKQRKAVSRGDGDKSGVDMNALLEQYPPPVDREAVDSAGQAGGDQRSQGQRLESRYQSLKDQSPQAELDLHGLSVLEAEAAMERFLRDAAARGLGKVLIIHGKGNHTRGVPVLERVVRAWLERSTLAGAFGRAERRHGGSGATWVILREGSYRSR